MCLSNFKAIRKFKVPISWLRDFTRSYEKTSFRVLRRGPGSFITVTLHQRHGVSNHRQLFSLFNSLLRLTANKDTRSRLRVIRRSPLDSPPNMMMSWHGNAFLITGHLWGEFTGHRWTPPEDSPHNGPVMQICDVSLEHGLNKLSNKQSRGRWTEMSSRSLYVTVMKISMTRKAFPCHGVNVGLWFF